MLETNENSTRRRILATSHSPDQIQDLIERYLNHELSPEEEQQWEEHYFSCDECFRRLEECAIAVSVVREEAPAVLGLGWQAKREATWKGILRFVVQPVLQPVAMQPALAAALVLVVVGIPAVIGWMRASSLQRRLTQLQLPSVPQASYVLEGAYRGEEQGPVTRVTLPPAGGPFLLSFHVMEVQDRSSVYRAEIVDPSGRTVWTEEQLRPLGRYGTFTLLCQTPFFEPGDYELHVHEVRPTDGTTLKQFVFPFQIITDSSG